MSCRGVVMNLNRTRGKMSEYAALPRVGGKAAS